MSTPTLTEASTNLIVQPPATVSPEGSPQKVGGRPKGSTKEKKHHLKQSIVATTNKISVKYHEMKNGTKIKLFGPKVESMFLF